MNNPWFRMYHEFSQDPVVQCLDFADQRHYVVILCLKCNGTLDRKITKVNKGRLICRGLGLSEKDTQKLKKNLQELKLIDKNWQPKGWSKRQYKSDGSTQRSRKYRKNKETGNVPETLQGTLHDRSGNGPETEQNRTDINTHNAREESAFFVSENFTPNKIKRRQIGSRRPDKNFEDELERFRGHRFKNPIRSDQEAQGLWVKWWLDELNIRAPRAVEKNNRFQAMDDWAEKAMAREESDREAM